MKHQKTPWMTSHWKSRWTKLIQSHWTLKALHDSKHDKGIRLLPSKILLKHTTSLSACRKCHRIGWKFVRGRLPHHSFLRQETTEKWASIRIIYQYRAWGECWFQKPFNVLVNLVPCRTVSEQSPLLHLSENRGVRLGAALCVLTKPMRTELGLRSSSVDEDGLPVFPILYASMSFTVQHGKAMCGSKNLQYIRLTGNTMNIWTNM